MVSVQEWLNNPKTIPKSKKSYAHFDSRTNAEKVASYIDKPSNIVHHGFYPFIHYTMKMDKYNKKLGKKSKKREICYAAHVDRCIFQYYAYMLNEYYNQRIKTDGIEKVPVAYRTDLNDSNIQSAKRAFDFIKNHPDCYVMIGDFTNFFDNLDHRYLKNQWCKLLNVQELPEDQYAVFKNITRYSKWELDNLLEINGLKNTYRDIKKLNNKDIVITKKQYKENRKNIKRNRNSFGIPQGSPISAVLANIYMLDADKIIYQSVKEYGGFYMRYSDDFIVILPKQKTDEAFKDIVNIIKDIPNLTLENKKTQLFQVQLPHIKNISRLFADDADSSQNKINFLGFSFDGKNIYIRSKTISKYYYRMNRKAKSIAMNKNYAGADKLYIRYSERGATSKRGNFFTYVNNSEREFGCDEMITHDVRRHMEKIRKSLKRNSAKIAGI